MVDTPRAGERMRALIIATIAGGSAIALSGWAPLALATPCAAKIDARGTDDVSLPTRSCAPEKAPDLAGRYPLPKIRGQVITEIYPSLAGWTHPVVNTKLVLPLLPTGFFGAGREGAVRHRRECGHGHCGDDISGPVGRPIVAVTGGVVVHVDRSRLGKDKHSGRYVRIEHDDGMLTSYMHLNSITSGLDKGDRVEAGQQIGTLGATAVYSAPPHLHFAVELPNVPGTHGDHEHTHYIDPSPFLVRATVIQAADRRRAKKPAM